MTHAAGAERGNEGSPALSGATHLYAILGDPIAQVASPRLFNSAFRRLGVDAVLVPFHVAPQGIPAVLEAFRVGQNFDGLVVTVPHKIAIASLIDEVGPLGRRIGAVNAIRKLPDGRLVGDNFDGLGFVRGLAGKGHTLRGRRVVVIGAGGAGSAVTHAILDEGPSALGVFDVDAVRLASLLGDLRLASSSVDIHAARADAEGYDVIVNCTSIGMHDGDPLPLAIDRLSETALVVDIILEPSETPLLRTASSRGCSTHPGIHMLDGQVDEICRFFGLGG
ncbi:shikimate dehydrogenase [Aureimonas sp. AU22]|uniref:shikimate dehydrogenase family protein n=1 Tax=Aureimonas sp. AU22 TaxID=1638162 RepID=UPI00078088BB|nr:shikimate dehydrogenase [Aureimonas sp. AU22]